MPHTTPTPIGQLINDEVCKQKLSVIEFAEKINCKRNNVYDIFKRNNMDIALLKRISKVLHRNFFAEIASNLNIVCEPLNNDRELTNSQRFAKFIEIVPKVLQSMNKEYTINIPSPQKGYEDCPIPDFTLSPYSLTFTIGETFRNRFGSDMTTIKIKQKTDEQGNIYELIYSSLTNTILLNIPVYEQTEEQWSEIFTYIFNEIFQENTI